MFFKEFGVEGEDTVKAYRRRAAVADQICGSTSADAVTLLVRYLLRCWTGVLPAAPGSNPALRAVDVRARCTAPFLTLFSHASKTTAST